MSLVKVQDHPGLVRDTESNGILNMDEKAYESHQRNKLTKALTIQKEKDKEERLNNIEANIATLEKKLDLILEKLINGNTIS